MKIHDVIFTLVIAITAVLRTWVISLATVEYAKIEFQHKNIEAVRCLNKDPPIANKARR